MDREIQEKADQAFQRRIEETGARDPREHYRTLLRELKARDEGEYEEMVARYREEVLTPIVEAGRDPLAAWLAFGRALAERLHGGRTVEVDGTGRALPPADPPSWESLILHLPGSRGQRAVAIGIPPEPTGPQRAALDLLVKGRIRLPEERSEPPSGT